MKEKSIAETRFAYSIEAATVLPEILKTSFRESGILGLTTTPKALLHAAFESSITERT